MRAKFVNESVEESVSYDEAVEFATILMQKIEGKTYKKILGPSVTLKSGSTDEYVIKTGGIYAYYMSGELDKLLNALEVVNDQMDNITWFVDEGDSLNSPKIRFDSKQEKETGEGITKFYQDKASIYKGD